MCYMHDDEVGIYIYIYMINIRKLEPYMWTLLIISALGIWSGKSIGLNGRITFKFCQKKLLTFKWSNGEHICIIISLWLVSKILLRKINILIAYGTD